MISINSNDFAEEGPTLEVLKPNVLAVEIIGDLTLELSKLQNGDFILDVTCGDETIKITRHRDLSMFQMGRLFEREVTAYRSIIRGTD